MDNLYGDRTAPSQKIAPAVQHLAKTHTPLLANHGLSEENPASMPTGTDAGFYIAFKGQSRLSTAFYNKQSIVRRFQVIAGPVPVAGER